MFPLEMNFLKSFDCSVLFLVGEFKKWNLRNRNTKLRKVSSSKWRET